MNNFTYLRTVLVILTLLGTMGVPALGLAAWNASVKVLETTPHCGSHCSVKMSCCESEYHLKLRLEVRLEGQLPATLKSSKLKLALTAWLPADALNLPVEAMANEAELGRLRRDKRSVSYVQLFTDPLGQIATTGVQTFDVTMRLERRTSQWHWMAKDCPGSTSLVIRSEITGRALQGAEAKDSKKEHLSFLTVLPPEQGGGRGACPR